MEEILVPEPDEKALVHHGGERLERQVVGQAARRCTPRLGRALVAHRGPGPPSPACLALTLSTFQASPPERHTAGRDFRGVST